MTSNHHTHHYLHAYQISTFRINQTRLEFELGSERTRVRSCLSLQRQSGRQGQELKLDGIGLELLSVRIDGVVLDTSAYRVTAKHLILLSPPDAFELACEVIINPAANTHLEGLYLTNGKFCTQCEAEGFRYITYYIDRPDVMSVFSTRICAEKARWPILLSNGNCTASGVDGDQHWVEWHDPFPKPSYLFALVAGDFACIQGVFTHGSGHRVDLHIYTEHHNREQCGHALQALQKAMAWDERVFGLEYDLELYMIVAVDDFNMGAMENKGLNVFNSRYVLADQQTATDADFLAVEAVIGHEYFHNWTGNRVTCRDWFQLSLKEGLTVFREQEFSADMASRALQRIMDVRRLRNSQFPEDAGPMAHPVRPLSYQEINNFYTATVYNKGAEVVRMIHSLLGAESFRQGLDLYFQRHDGQAVTTDDFRLAMQDASGIDLSQFQLWYAQSGTPEVSIERSYHPDSQKLELVVRQAPGVTAGKVNQAFHMPMRLSLFDRQGRPLALDAEQHFEQVLDVKESLQKFVFSEIREKPLISAFRGFSAPIRLQTDLDDDELLQLMSCDTDAFNRWEASQQYVTKFMLGMMGSAKEQWPDSLQQLVHAYGVLLEDSGADLALTTEMLILPGEKYLAEQLERVDVHQLRQVTQSVKYAIAQAHEQSLLAQYRCYSQTDDHPSVPEAVSRRRKNICLAYLLTLEKSEYFDLCLQQFQAATNMTDQMGCLSPVVHYQHPLREQILAEFYQQWHKVPLVLDKWFSAQASCLLDHALELIMPLFQHRDYSLDHPNRAQSLLGALTANSCAFHQLDGAGYRFVADRIMELDLINPQIAARTANALIYWRHFCAPHSELMRQQVDRILSSRRLSSGLNELLTRSLAS